MYYLGSTQAVGSGSASAHTVLSGIEVLYLEPGLAAFVPIGYLFAGGDLNALVFPNLTAPGASKSMAAVLLSFHAQVGFRF